MSEALFLLINLLLVTYFTKDSLVLPYQLAAQDLADRGLGQLHPELVVGGDFVRRQMFLAEGFEFFHGQRLAGFDHDPGFDRLAAIGVRDAATPTSSTFGCAATLLPLHAARPGNRPA
jgi:hypothetical protein